MGAFLCCTRRRSHHDFFDAIKIYHERKSLEMRERQQQQFEDLYQQQSYLMESFQSLSFRSAQELPSEEFYSTISGLLDADDCYYSQEPSTLLSQSNSNEMSPSSSASSFSAVEQNDSFYLSFLQQYGLHEDTLSLTRRERVFTI